MKKEGFLVNFNNYFLILKEMLNMKTTENNCNITNLRGSKLGVIRLSNLADPREKDFEIKIELRG